MMGHRQVLRSGDEWDCLYWRNVLKLFGKSGTSAKTKRKMRRRERRQVKQELRLQ